MRRELPLRYHPVSIKVIIENLEVFEVDRSKQDGRNFGNEIFGLKTLMRKREDKTKVFWLKEIRGVLKKKRKETERGIGRLICLNLMKKKSMKLTSKTSVNQWMTKSSRNRGKVTFFLQKNWIEKEFSQFSQFHHEEDNRMIRKPNSTRVGRTKMKEDGNK